MAVEQPAMLDVDYPPPERSRAWVRPCGAPGPYAIRRPTDHNPGRLEVATCTRPEGHSGFFHQHAETSRGVICQWGRDGKPDWPPILRVKEL